MRKVHKEFTVKLTNDTNGILISSKKYNLQYSPADTMHIDLTFANGMGAKLLIASGCDCNKMIDEIKALKQEKADMRKHIEEMDMQLRKLLIDKLTEDSKKKKV
jgi:hypothetical protein